MPPVRPKRKQAEPDDDSVLPAHTVLTTLRMPQLRDALRMDVFHYIQQHCFVHHCEPPAAAAADADGSHVDTAHPYGPPRVDELHITAPRSEALVPAVCGVIADVLERPVRYRLGNVSDVVRPAVLADRTHLLVTVTQRSHGAPDLYRAPCGCEGCNSSSSSSGSDAEANGNGDKGGESSSSSSSSGGSRRKRRRLSAGRRYFALGGDNPPTLSRTRSGALVSPLRPRSSLSPPPTSPRAVPRTPTSQPPPIEYLSPRRPSAPKSSPPAPSA
jgi:hypothetical protein